MQNSYKIGIVGVGSIAQTYFKVLRRMPEVEVAFLCDIVPSQMTRAAERFPDLLANVGHFESSDDAIDALQAEGKTVDTVIIATPLGTHYFLSVRALKRGVRVLLEKPGVSKIEDLYDLYTLAKENRTTFQTMYHFAYAPEVERFWGLRNAMLKKLGTLRAFSCDFHDPAVVRRDVPEGAPEAWRLLATPRKEDGSYMDSAVNALSVLDRVLCLEEMKDLTIHSHVPHQVPRLTDRNGEIVPPLVDTSSITEYRAKNRNLCGTIRTDWAQGWSFKGTFLQYENGTVSLNHANQTITASYYDVANPVTIPCSNGISRQEREYETMFRHLFFEPQPLESVRPRDFRIHELHLGASIEPIKPVKEGTKCPY